MWGVAGCNFRAGPFADQVGDAMLAGLPGAKECRFAAVSIAACACWALAYWKFGVYEPDVLSAFEKGQLKSVATKVELAKFKAAARATAIKGRRVNSRLSSGRRQNVALHQAANPSPWQRRPTAYPATAVSAWALTRGGTI